MFIKLSFTANKYLNTVFRTVHEIINDNTITSVATLNSKATSNSWNSNTLQYLDTASSLIVRTGSGVTGITSNTASHYARATTDTSYQDNFDWTVQFSVHDNTATKFYVQHKITAPGNQTANVNIGTTVTGTFSSNQDVGQAPTSTSTPGSALTIGGTASASHPVSFVDSNSFGTIRTLFMYITDTCMVWGATCTTGVPGLGMQGTYSNNTYWLGPFIYSQYDRFDYHNNDTNGVIPLMFTNVYTTGQGFGWAAQTYGVENSIYSSTKQNQFRVLNLINAYPNTSVTYPMIVGPAVNWGVGSRYNDYAGLTSSSAGAGTTITALSYGQVLFTSAGVRYPSIDLREATFAMLPISWRHLYYYNTGGGDASSRGGWYLFNGDYFPGDEFTYNSKTYIILPTWSGYSSRLGIAIPKE